MIEAPQNKFLAECIFDSHQMMTRNLNGSSFYRGDQSTRGLKSGNIQSPDYLVSSFQMVGPIVCLVRPFEYSTKYSGFQMTSKIGTQRSDFSNSLKNKTKNAQINHKPDLCVLWFGHNWKFEPPDAKLKKRPTVAMDQDHGRADIPAIHTPKFFVSASNLHGVLQTLRLIQ